MSLFKTNLKTYGELNKYLVKNDTYLKSHPSFNFIVFDKKTMTTIGKINFETSSEMQIKDIFEAEPEFDDNVSFSDVELISVNRNEFEVLTTKQNTYDPNYVIMPRKIEDEDLSQDFAHIPILFF